MAVYQLGSSRPKIDASAFVHPDATVIGAVVLGARSSVWPQVTLRGDTETLIIGDESNIQDGTVVHADMGCPFILGRGVTVGHQVMLHGCIIGDGSLIGIQSVILNRAKIGKQCLVGAGSLITEGKEFPDRVLILGSPARVVRPLTDEEVAKLSVNSRVYVERAEQYMREMQRISDE
jgi:carbonic anhydrase/acetyltransferase-like protein (isoleucine patch superfamily)